jgi:hypothetical protein
MKDHLSIAVEQTERVNLVTITFSAPAFIVADTEDYDDD